MSLIPLTSSMSHRSKSGIFSFPAKQFKCSLRVSTATFVVFVSLFNLPRIITLPTRKHSSRMRLARFGGHHLMSVLGGVVKSYPPHWYTLWYTHLFLVCLPFPSISTPISLLNPLVVYSHPQYTHAPPPTKGPGTRHTPHGQNDRQTDSCI